MSRAVKNLIQLIMFALVLGGSIVIARWFVETKKEPPKRERTEPVALVEAITLEARSESVHVNAQGVVVPARSVAVAPEVGGRVRWINSKLEAGGIIEDNERLVRINSSDYRASVEQNEIALENARVAAELEESRRLVAQREWEMYGGGGGNAAAATREPQLRSAQANIRAAETALSLARTNLHRTGLRAPFRAYVQSRNVDIGAVVGPQSPIAVLIGVEAFWVEVSVPVEALPWLRFEESLHDNEGGAGSAAVVTQRVGESVIRREGHALRLMQELDPVGRMARVIVEVPDPLRLNEDAPEPADGELDLPLLAGAWVDVDMQGPVFEGVASVPRAALRDGDTVWRIDSESRLEFAPCDVVWRGAENVLVRLGEGLREGDRIVTSPIGVPTAGLMLRVGGEAPSIEGDEDRGAAIHSDASEATQK